MRIHAWRVPYEDIPREREALASWFAEQWERVDGFVEAVETGTPVIAGAPETVG
ncbi:MAG: hypothetical protein U5Q44_06105 [Dehalococcoidia bacterium]|nr:hypothetical protein [Dehalococcoidia bacterium]